MDPELILISPGLCSKLESETRRTAPDEACGLLFGSVSGSRLILNAWVATRSTRPSPVHFGIDGDQLAEAVRKMRGPVRALFHSHPRRLHPSRCDLAGIRATGIPWLIAVSGPGGFWFQAFALRAGRVRVVPHVGGGTE
jgi:proteasome lid subunit RPN8/RPN11